MKGGDVSVPAVRHDIESVHRGPSSSSQRRRSPSGAFGRECALDARYGRNLSNS